MRKFRIRSVLVLLTMSALLASVVGIRWRFARLKIDLQNRSMVITATDSPTLKGFLFPRARAYYVSIERATSVSSLLPFHGPLELNLLGEEIETTLIEEIAGLNDVKSLRVRHADSNFIPLIAKIDSLEKLDLGGSRIEIDYQSAKLISRLKRLRILNLSGTKISDSSLPAMAQIGLTDLQLNDTAVTSDSLPSISKLRQLTSLDLSRTKISDRNLEKLEELEELRELRLNQTDISGQALDAISMIPRLEVLELNYCNVEELALFKLKNSKLKRLSVDRISFDKFGMSPIQKSMPSCQISHRHGVYGITPFATVEVDIDFEDAIDAIFEQEDKTKVPGTANKNKVPSKNKVPGAKNENDPVKTVVKPLE